MTALHRHAAGALAAILLLSPAARAQDAPAAGYPKSVDSAAVRGYAEVTPRPAVTIVDVRSAGFDGGHIPGAISIPAQQFEAQVAALPLDRQEPLVYYCENANCPESRASAVKAERLGYPNVGVYAGGFADWLSGGGTIAVSAAYIERLARDRLEHTLIDSRPRRTAARGMIPGAVNIPDGEFEQHVARLPADRGRLLIFYCGGLDCPLSSFSAAKARQLGYRNVRTYPEGYPEWVRLHGPASVVPAGAAIEPGKEKGSITVASFEKILKEQPDAINLVDVRDPKEFAAGTIKGAKNIPMNVLEKQIDQLPRDKPTVFICGSGARAGEAYDTAKLVKPDLPVHFVDAEIKFQGDGKYTIKQK